MKANDNQALALSFIVLIGVGAFLLWLPFSYSAGKLSFIDALFTATSAVCVTGLTTVNISDFTPWGQAVIAVLIQLGGIGILTFSTFFIFSMGRRISFSNRSFIQDSIRGYVARDLFHVFKAILFFTFSVEILGAGILFIRFSKLYPLHESVFCSIFHSVSAFCNAGLSLFPTSMTAFRGDGLVNLTLMGLIIAGGLGFLVLDDLVQAVRAFFGRREYRISFHTRVMLWSTLFLIISGAVAFFGLERENILKTLSGKEQVLVSFFQSITARTCGFNTVDIGKLTEPTSFVLISLMFIGAGANSTGGGIKVSTFAILFALFLCRLQGRRSTSISRRKIPDDIVGRSLTVATAALLLIFVTVIILEVLEHYGEAHMMGQGSFLEILFETVSAFGTVGLSMGITPFLTSASKWVLILTMFAGRIGPLTLAFAIGMKESQLDRYEYPEEDVMVG
ncbi:MAG TPA: TrkH family potassium uptake protein [Candidatus Omnitrophota bacterium]|nr:TrkH family potassium uptake protein [Candidatus Omnitrophota bacterium]